MLKPYSILDQKAPLSYQEILADIQLVRRTGAREEAFYASRPFTYTYGAGQGARTYHAQPFPSLIRAMAEFIAFEVSPLDLCFINHYPNERQHLGWHADDSPEQDDGAPIVVVSFGAERFLWVREKGTDTVDKILLPENSIFVMEAGMQQTHEHRIPKHDRACGPRLSLTFRRSKQ